MSVKGGVLAPEGNDQKGAAQSNLGGQESGEDAGVRFSWMMLRAQQVVQMGERALGEGGGVHRGCVCCAWLKRVAGCLWLILSAGFSGSRCSLAFGCEHVLGSPVQLQGRDGADVSGQFRFPPHQRALSTLLLLELNERREIQINGSKPRTHPSGAAPP